MTHDDISLSSVHVIPKRRTEPINSHSLTINKMKCQNEYIKVRFEIRPIHQRIETDKCLKIDSFAREVVQRLKFESPMIALRKDRERSLDSIFIAPSRLCYTKYERAERRVCIFFSTHLSKEFRRRNKVLFSGNACSPSC